MKTDKRKMILAFLAPSVIAYMFVSIYPVIHSTIFLRCRPGLEVK
jgi:hypothetical protein